MAKSLQDYLIKISENNENLNSLVQLLKKKRDECVCFLGAGLSAQIKGVPDSTELADYLNKYYKKRRVFDGDLAKFCSKIYKTLQEKDRAEFYLVIFEKIQPSDCLGTHTELCKIFSSFVTLNYKDVIELAFRRLHNNEKELSVFYFQYPRDYPDPNVTYLHGHEKLGTAILREEDYKYYYSFVHKQGQALVLFNSYKYLLEKKNVVFHALSMENWISETLKKLKSEADSFGEHFWVVEKGAWEKFKKRHFAEPRGNNQRQSEDVTGNAINECKKVFGVMPIIYDDSTHQFMASLCAEVGTKTPSTLEEPPIDSIKRVNS